MIKLENISIEMFNIKLKNKLNAGEDFEEILNAISTLKNYSVVNYQQLKDLIESGNQDFNIMLFKKELENIENKVEIANSQGIEPELYGSNGYKLGIVDLRSLELTDKHTSGRELILKSPTHIKHTNRDGFVDSHSIEQLKFMLSHIHPNFRNMLLYGNYCLKREDVPKLIKAINFYEEQVIRQAKEIKKDLSIYLPRNIFEYDKQIKKELVTEQIKEITEYLVDCGSGYIWGKLSDAEKLRLIKSVSSQNGNQIIRRNMIDIVANYTTLSEIENGVKTQTLKRFIIKHR